MAGLTMEGDSEMLPHTINSHTINAHALNLHAISSVAHEFASDVRDGLTRPGQKELPSKYLYDDVGSALFEVISHLPEYGLTRADERLLQRHASEIVELLEAPVAVAELGSGSGKKTRWIFEALGRWQRNLDRKD